MSEELIGLLNALATHPEAVVRHTVINAKDRITALIAAGNKLALEITITNVIGLIVNAASVASPMR